MKVVAISDTHNKHNNLKLPEGDILLHAGDFSFTGDTESCSNFGRWFSNLPYKKKFLVYGNHDILGETNPAYAKHLIALNDSVHIFDGSNLNDVYEIDGIRICGSPIQPEFNGWAFNRDSEFRKKYWENLPEKIDILLTHCPPLSILDSFPVRNTLKILSVGDEYLLDAVKKVKPKYHVFGHIHESYGTLITKDTTFINASFVDEHYSGVNKPIIFGV